MADHVVNQDNAWTPGRFALLLTCVPGVGNHLLSRLLRHQSLAGAAPAEFLASSSEQLLASWPITAVAAAAAADRREVWWPRFEHLDSLVRKHHIEVLTPQHHLYPTDIETFCDDPPAVLFALGQLSLLSDGWRYCMACSRGAGAVVIEAMRDLVGTCAGKQGIAVTGHNTAGYQAVGLAAIRAGLPHITVLDRGMGAAMGPRLDMPLFNTARLYEMEFRADRDLVISPFPPDVGSIGLHNQRRDEIIFALSDVVWRMHVRPGGNMDRLCERSQSIGRRVEVWNPPSG